MDRRVLLLIFLIATPVYPRRSSSGGGFNRGSSGARTNVGGGSPGGGSPSGGFNNGGFRPNPQPSNTGGFRPNPQPSNTGGFNNGGVRPNPQPTNTGGFNNGGFRPNPQPQPHPSGGFNNPGGFRPSGPGSFSNTGMGSRASSGSWKTALAAGALGAVGGVIAWEAGKAIIHSASTPFNSGGRNYYFGDNNYQGQKGMMQCSMPLEELQKINAAPITTTTTTTTTVAPSDGSTTTVDPNAATTTTAAPTPDQIFSNLQFADGTRPKTVTWGCKSGVEICCGTECCPAPSNIQNNPNGGSSHSSGGTGSTIGTVVLLIIIFLLLLCCCGCFIIYKCFGGLFDCLKGDNKNDQHYEQGGGEYPMQSYGQQPAYAQQQPYDNNQYGQQSGGYPPAPVYPNQYNPNQYPAYPPQQQGYHQY